MTKLEQASIQIMAAVAPEIYKAIVAAPDGDNALLRDTLVKSVTEWAVMIAATTLNAAHTQDIKLYNQN